MITYCEKWSLGRKRALPRLTPDAARKRHDRGKIYAALLGEDPERPDRVVEVVLENQFVGVSYLDEHLREAREHARLFPELRFTTLQATDSRAARRGLEQMAHDQFQPILNKINPISPRNPNRGRYMDAAKRFLEGGGG